MPYKISKLKDGKVRVTSLHNVRAKKTTLKKAKAQVRLLHEKGYGTPKEDGSGKGRRANRGRGGCKKTRKTGNFS